MRWLKIVHYFLQMRQFLNIEKYATEYALFFEEIEDYKMCSKESKYGLYHVTITVH